MKIKNSGGGYSPQKAQKYVDIEKKFLLVEEAKEIYEYDKEAKKYTEEVVGYKVKLVQKGTEAFDLKLQEKPEKVEQLDCVEVEGIEAYEDRERGRVYFRAKAIKKVN